MHCTLISNLARIERDRVTGWVKATDVSGQVFLIHPHDALALMAWSQGHACKFSDSMAANYFIESKKLHAKVVAGQPRAL